LAIPDFGKRDFLKSRGDFSAGRAVRAYIWCEKARFCWALCICGISPQAPEKKRFFRLFCV
jgi:hypothetical protein